MARRQYEPEQWLIVAGSADSEMWSALRRLPRRSGVLVLHSLSAGERRRLRNLARARGLILASERAAARVHNFRELRSALLRRPSMVLLSPMHPTRSHPDWQPLRRMRAATLARLAGRRAIALGGMNRQRYAKIAPLGFIGWAGISAFRI
jgi:thiamine-phosphate pyrophosphorylase